MKKLIKVSGPDMAVKNDGNLYSWEDWEHEGGLDYIGETSLKRYHEIHDDMYHHKHEGVFFAFSDSQFEEGCKQLGIDQKGNLKGVLFRIPGGGFGTREGLDKMYAYYDSIDERIKNECDPQEVYLYEYNNHEGCINLDGDTEAVEIIIDTWGADVARQLVRYRALYTIDEIIERNKR